MDPATIVSKLKPGEKIPQWVERMKAGPLTYDKLLALAFDLPPDGETEQEQFDQAMIDFLCGDLTAEKIPPKKELLVWDTWGGHLRLQPIRKEVKLADKTLPAMLKSLERCTSTDDMRPSMNYICSDGDYLIATDGFKLLKVKFPANDGLHMGPSLEKRIAKLPEHDGGEAGYAYKSVCKRDFDVTRLRFPDYMAVWPEYKDDYETYRYIDLKALLGVSLAAERAGKFFIPERNTDYPVKLRLVSDNKVVWVAPANLNDLLLTLLEQGEQWVKLRMSKPIKAIVFQGVNASGLLMPVMANDHEQNIYATFRA